MSNYNKILIFLLKINYFIIQNLKKQWLSHSSLGNSLLHITPKSKIQEQANHIGRTKMLATSLLPKFFKRKKLSFF